MFLFRCLENIVKETLELFSLFKEERERETGREREKEAETEREGGGRGNERARINASRHSWNKKK